MHRIALVVAIAMGLLTRGLYAASDAAPATASPASPTVDLGNLADFPPALHVAGNRLATDAGKEVWLQGLCVDSLQWSPTGEHLKQSIPVAIDEWHANAIRLPVSDEFWFGRHQGQTDGGAAYRQVVDATIRDILAHHAYVVLDLHRFYAPLPQDAAFWKDAATRYKNNPGVIFELFNEPHDISWSVWRDGGSLKKRGGNANAVAENGQKAGSDTTVGMQALVDAVRSAGADNLLVAGGLDWSYDLRGVTEGYALKDHPGGHGIMYSWHVYPWKFNWKQSLFAAADEYPIFVTEVGCPRSWSDFSFIPKVSQREKLGPGCTWPQDVLGLIQSKKLNWTGFSFHPTCGPNAISDWNYTPTPFWGAYVKEALSGQQFTSERLR